MLKPSRDRLMRLLGLVFLLLLGSDGHEHAHNRACAHHRSAELTASANLGTALAATPVRVRVDVSTAEHSPSLLVQAGTAIHADAAPALQIGTARSREPSRGEGARPPPSLA